jgi:hypothetical protein
MMLGIEGPCLMFKKKTRSSLFFAEIIGDGAKLAFK